MNTLIAQLACLLLFASMICNSLQLPSLEDEVKRTSHKLMRFGRTSAHNMMHFGKRGNSNESGEDADPSLVKQEELVSVEPMDNKVLIYSLLNPNYWSRWRKSSDRPIPGTGSDSDSEANRRAQLTIPTLVYATPNAYLRARPHFYFDKKAENQDNVFMHFG